MNIIKICPKYNIIFNMNIDNFYKYAIITRDNIILFNESTHEGNISSSNFLVNVHVKFEDDVLDITADEIIYDFYYNKNHGYKIYEKDWIHEPHPKCINKGKYWWEKLLGIGKEKRFVYSGWVRTTETEPIHFIFNKFNKFKIEIYD